MKLGLLLRYHGETGGPNMDLVLEAEAPSFDNGELTDKGAAASRIVLARRASVVAALHAEKPSATIYRA